MVFRGLSSWLRSGEVSPELYNELVGFVASYINSKKVDSRKFGIPRQELVYEIVHSFVLKMPKLRIQILERSRTPEGYFVSSLRNFVIDFLSNGAEHALSLDFESDSGSSLLETLGSEEIAEDLHSEFECEQLEAARTELAEKLESSSGSVLRNLKVFVLTELAGDSGKLEPERLGRLGSDYHEQFGELTAPNVYKMRQRAKEFLRTFAQEHGYSGRVVVRAALDYLKLRTLEVRTPETASSQR